MITGTNIFGLILASKENLVHKVPVTGDFGKTDCVILVLEFGLSWVGYSLIGTLDFKDDCENFRNEKTQKKVQKGSKKCL